MSVVDRAHTRALVSSTPALAWLPMSLTVVVTLEAFRVLFPGLFGLKERTSTTTTLLIVAVVALAPLVTPYLTHVLGRRRTTVAALSALAVWRIAVQLPSSISMALAGVGAVAGLIALTVVVSGPAGGDVVSRGAGLIVGFGVDLALLASFGTWEPAFQRGAGAFIVGMAIAAGLVLSALWLGRLGRDDASNEPSSPSLAAGVAIGATIALEVLFLANTGYISAAAGIGLTSATVVAMLGLLGGLVGVVRAGTFGAAVTVAAVIVLTAAGFLLPEADGAIVIGIIWVAQIAAGVIVGTAVATQTASPTRSEIGLALGWILTVVSILLFQLHYDQPLPIDNRYVTASLGLVTALAALPSRGRSAVPRRRAWAPAVSALAVVGLLATGVVAMTAPSIEPAPSALEPLHVVQWNIRLAVDDQGQVDPQTIADDITSQGDIDIIVLNEAVRGWPLSGQLDLAEWLARRLDMHVAWAGAASQQFGTLVLSRFPIESADVIQLPTAGTSQGRSLLHAVLDLGNDSNLDVLATHLQHRNDPASMAKRMEEIDIIIDEWNRSPRTILAGDLNPKQGDPPEYPPRRPGDFAEISTLLDAGFTTAAELDGCSAPTTGSNCSDYIFVSPDLVQPNYEVGELFGDHRMLVSTVAQHPSP